MFSIKILVLILVLLLLLLLLNQTHGDITPNILEGEFAKHGEFPAIVALKIRRSHTVYVCGGVLINARNILTAAHCVYHIKHNAVNMEFY